MARRGVGVEGLLLSQMLLVRRDLRGGLLFEAMGVPALNLRSPASEAIMGGAATTGLEVVVVDIVVAATVMAVYNPSLLRAHGLISLLPRYVPGCCPEQCVADRVARMKRVKAGEGWT